MVNSPLIRPAISWGIRGIGGVGPLDSHEYIEEPQILGLLTATKRYDPSGFVLTSCWDMRQDFGPPLVINEKIQPSNSY